MDPWQRDMDEKSYWKGNVVAQADIPRSQSTSHLVEGGPKLDERWEGGNTIINPTNHRVQ